MLHELVEYGQSHGLTSAPGFAAKRARWLIVLAENGQFVDVLDDPRDFAMAPNLTFSELVSGTDVRSHFLLDSLPVVTLYGASDPKQGQKHANFIALLRQAAATCPECALCANVLEDADTVARMHLLLAARKAKPTDTATFLVGTKALPELTAWRDWWQSYRTTLRAAPDPGPGAIGADATDNRMICFVTGETVAPAPTHAKIMGLGSVGGQSSGSSLISFDKEAFTSFSFDQSANAACSEEAVAQYVGALQDLVRKAPRPLGGMLMLHWFDKVIPLEDDPFSDLLTGDDEEGDADEAEPEGDGGSASAQPVRKQKGKPRSDAGRLIRRSQEATAALKARKLLEAVREGNRPEFMNSRYFVLQVAGAGGRVSVRDWFNGDFRELVQSINQWYDDLALVGPEGGAVASPDKLTALLIRLVVYRPGEQQNKLFERINQQLPPVIPRLWHAILQGAPLADAMPQAALAYIRSKQLRSDDDKSSDNLDRIACSLLKAWLIRRAPPQEGKPIMEAKVNKEHPSAAYQTGRLLAVLAAIQSTAMPDVGAGVVQRYYASASSTPALVVGRLTRNAQYHLDKIESKGLVYWYEQQLAEIMTHLGDGLPATLTLEGQTLFALGYYQQKAEMSQKKESGARAPADETNSDSSTQSSTGEN